MCGPIQTPNPIISNHFKHIKHLKDYQDLLEITPTIELHSVTST
jgi:hypothetical protein